MRPFFVIPAANFREIPAFIAQGENTQADFVGFRRIFNSGTYPDEKFAEIDVCDPGHKDHPEFLAVIDKATRRTESKTEGSIFLRDGRGSEHM